MTHKRDVLLPKWLPIVTEYVQQLEQDTQHDGISDHPIFAYCVVWLFDIGDLEQALELGFKAIRFDQPMAPGIRRNWPGFIADTVYDWASEQAEKGRSIEPYFSRVFKQVAHSWKLPEPVTAKFYKFAGLSLLRNKNGEVAPSHIGDVTDLQQADAMLAKAAELHKHAQVKTVRNKIAMRLRAIAELNAQ